MKADWIIQRARLVARQPLLRWLIGFKGVYWLVLLGALWLGDGFDTGKFYAQAAVARWPREGDPVFASHFGTWDAAHYLFLGEEGYQPGMPSCAFYPLWPLLVSGASGLTGGSQMWGGLMLSNVISLAAWVLFYQLAAQRWGQRAGNWSLAFLLAFPGSLFFQFNYTESLFLLLVMGLWYGLEKRRYGVAALAAGLLPLTRAVGVFAVLPIAWHALRETGWLRQGDSRRQIGGGERKEEDGGLSTEDGRRKAEDRELGPQSSGLRAEVGSGSTESRPTTLDCGRRKADFGFGNQERQKVPESLSSKFKISDCGFRWSPWLLLAAPLIGWGCYLALMWHWTGNPFEGFEAQKHWGVHSVWNLVNVPKFVIGFFTPTQWHAFTGSLLDRCVFVLLLYTLPVLWRLDKGLLVWTYWLGILPAMSGTFTSYSRFASCAFPMFIALGAFLSPKMEDGSSKMGAWLRWGLLAVFAVLHVVLVWRFVNFRWAG